MQVIGAGLGRTGTLSLKVALERLGAGPCFHMRELFRAPGRAAAFRAAFRVAIPAAGAAGTDEPVDWDVVFAGYRSTMDWPGCAFLPQLTAAYPDAKVVLSVRNADAWYASTSRTIGPDADPYTLEMLRATAPHLVPVRELMDELVWYGTFGGRFAERAFAIEVYERHNARVRREVAADRLLEYRIGDGWAPLCEFLGVPVPDEEFPHLNEGRGVRRAQAERLAGSRGRAPGSGS